MGPPSEAPGHLPRLQTNYRIHLRGPTMPTQWGIIPEPAMHSAAPPDKRIPPTSHPLPQRSNYNSRPR